MDGVLYDSMPSHVRSWRETTASLGIESDEEDFYLYEGRTGASTIDILFNRTLGRNATPEEIEKIYAQKTKRFVELESPKSKPMPGAMEVLEKIKSLGLKRVIVTGSGQHSLIDRLQKDFPGFFEKDLMVTAYDVKFGKPHPEPYLMGLVKAGVRADEALVVENAPLGVKSAKEAGITTIAVNTGPLSDRILADAGANRIFPDMKTLANFFHTLPESAQIQPEYFHRFHCPAN